MDAPGRPILLGTTEEFLRNFRCPVLDGTAGGQPCGQVEDFKAQAEEEVHMRLDI